MGIEMTAKEIHKLLSGFIVTVRKNKVIVCLGYTDAPENFMQYNETKEAKALEILNGVGIEPSRHIERDYKYHIIRLKFTI